MIGGNMSCDHEQGGGVRMVTWFHTDFFFFFACGHF